MALRQIRLLLLVLALGVALMPSAGASAPDGIYLSMGNSVAAGTQPAAPVTDTAYTDVLFRRTAADLGLAAHIDVSCPGEDSTELITGVGSYCFTPGASQLDAALAVIAANPRAVRLITIDIGANDVLGCTSEPDMNACVGAALPILGGNLAYILATLQAAAPGADIVGMNYYNPLMAYQLSPNPVEQGMAAASDGLVHALNTVTLESVYGAFGVPVADVERKFKTFNTAGAVYPRNLRFICKFTYMCEKSGSGLILSDWDPGEPGAQPDIHPTPRGHRKIAAAFSAVMEKAGIL